MNFMMTNRFALNNGGGGGGGRERKQNVEDIIYDKNEIEDWKNCFHNMLQFYNVVTQEFLVYYTVISVTFTTEFLVHFFAHKAVFKTRHVMTAPSLTKHASLRSESSYFSLNYLSERKYLLL